MKNNILIIIFSSTLMTGCATQNLTVTKNKKITETDCKKMLGTETYNQLNELYNDPTAAMLQCKFRLEDKVKP